MGMHKSGRNDTKTPGTTLSEYLNNKYPEEKKKLTFEEWWSLQLPIYGDKPFEYMVDAAEASWKAAQENCTNRAGE